MTYENLAWALTVVAGFGLAVIVGIYLAFKDAPTNDDRNEER